MFKCECCDEEFEDGLVDDLCGLCTLSLIEIAEEADAEERRQEA